MTGTASTRSVRFLPTVTEHLPGSTSCGMFLEAVEHVNAGRTAEAHESMKAAVASHSTDAVLQAIGARTKEIMDASDVSGPRWQGVKEGDIPLLLLSDKARDLQQWTNLLTESAAWTVLADAPGCLAVRQALVEAMERVAVAGYLCELDSKRPEVFAIAIATVASKQDAAGSVGPDRFAFYSQVSIIERLLLPLAQLPRSLPLGSSDVFDAVLFVNEVAATFLDTALGRRKRLAEAFPQLLPCPTEGMRSRFGTAPPFPGGVGSSWLSSTHMRTALQALRKLCLDVMPAAHLLQLPLLAAQSLRVVESLAALCAVTLQAEVSAQGGAEGDALRQPKKQEILADLVEVELHLMAQTSQSQCPHRALRLAEDFDDFDTLALVAARFDRLRLQRHMDKSEEFRLRAMRLFLENRDLLPLFYSTLDRHRIPLPQLEELLAPYPEIRWTLDLLQSPVNSGSATEAQWQESLNVVRQRVTTAAQKEMDSDKRRDGLLAIAHIAAAAAVRA